MVTSNYSNVKTIRRNCQSSSPIKLMRPRFRAGEINFSLVDYSERSLHSILFKIFLVLSLVLKGKNSIISYSFKLILSIFVILFSAILKHIQSSLFNENFLNI